MSEESCGDSKIGGGGIEVEVVGLGEQFFLLFCGGTLGHAGDPPWIEILHYSTYG